MTRRLPITLWLYLLGDLWKLVLLTTTVLVTVIAFAAAVKPLADGKLGPEDTLKFMLLAMVPMLQYALPFAACFGATLAYHRLATENELTAVYAGGISHRALLVPALASGLLLAGILLALSNSIIPTFLKGMSQLVAQDAAKVIVNTIRRGEALRIGNTFIYADRVEPLGPDKASGSYERLWLGGLLVVRTTEQGTIANQMSAASASVWMQRANVTRGGAEGGAPAGGATMSAKPMTKVIIKPKDAVGLSTAGKGQMDEGVFTYLVPNAFADNVKFLSFSELRALRNEPERIDRIEKAKRALAMSVAEREVVDAIDHSLRNSGMARFKDFYGQSITLRAAGLRSTWRDKRRDASIFQVLPALPEKKVFVETVSTDGKRQRQLAAGAFVRLPTESDPERRGGAATVTIQLNQVAAEAIGPDGEVQAPPDEEVPAARGELEERPLADLTFEGDNAQALMSRGTFDVERMAAQRIKLKPADGAVIRGRLGELSRDVQDLLREVLSKEQERYAMSVACLVMVLVGAVMAMRLREALPLTVYLWAFFPALATVVAIAGGQQLTHGNGLVGLPVLWAGVAALGMFAGVEFARLCKH